MLHVTSSPTGTRAPIRTLFVLCLALCASCGQAFDPPASDPPPAWGEAFGVAFDATGAPLFSGRVGSSSSDCYPVYWDAEGRLRRLTLGSGDTWGKASRIAVSAGGDVFVSGFVGTASADSRPCYWKNGTLHALDNTGYTSFTVGEVGIDSTGAFIVAGVLGTSVAGSRRPFYWKDGARTAIGLASGYSGAAYGLAFDSGGAPQFSGWRSAGGSDWGATRWATGVEFVPLPMPSSSSSYNVYELEVAGDRRCVAGYAGPSGSATLPYVWIDDVLTELPHDVGTTGSCMSLTSLADGRLAVAGDVDGKDVLWTETSTPGEFGDPVPFDVQGRSNQFSGGTVLRLGPDGALYLAGLLGDSDSSATPGYWKDNSFRSLPKE